MFIFCLKNIYFYCEECNFQVCFSNTKNQRFTIMKGIGFVLLEAH